MPSNKSEASRRLSILSTEEVDSLYGLPHFTEGERQIHFDLSPEERETIDAARTITAGVHLVLQLGYFKAKAQFFVVSLDHVRPDIDHILTRYFPGRLMVEVRSLSKPTRLAQQRIILELLDYRLCGSEGRQALFAFAQRAAMLSTQPKFILREVLEHLSSQRIVAPGYTSLQDLVSQAVTDERKRVTRKLDATLPADLQQSLNTLLHADDKIHLINVLKHEASDFSNKELRQEVGRRKQLAPLHAFAQTFLMDATLSRESIKYYAGLVQFYTIYKLRRMDISTVRLYLLCFAFHRFRQINDNLIEAFIHLVGQFDKHAKLAAKVAMQQASDEANSNLKAAGEVLGLFVDESIASDCPFSTVKERAFGLLEPAAFPSVSNFLRNVAFDKLDYEWTYFTMLSPTIKRNLRHLFCDIDFAGRLENAPLVTAIAMMQDLLRRSKSLRQADSSKFPETVIPPALKKHLYVESIEDGEKRKTLDVDRYEFLVYRLLRNALESGDLYVHHSNEFRQFEDDLISDARWAHKDAVLAEIGQPFLTTPIEETLATLRAKLEDRLVTVNQRVAACVNTNIKVVGQGDKKRWSLIYPTAPETSNTPFYSQLPGIPVADLLRFVNKETHFLDAFEHVLNRSVKHAPDLRQILACVVAYGTNMGLGKMAEVSGLSHASLITTARSYLRPETVHAANDAISNATAALPAFKLFNIRDELHSSSDGQRFETQINTFNSRYSPKYFGWDKGVSACTVVANHVPINAKIIGTHEHESHFVFDLLYNNTSEIKPTRHSTDTHGTNQVNYLCLYASGYSFAPRYKTVQKKTAALVGFKLPSQYPADMLIRPTNRANEELIISEWPNIQRILASLAQKDTTQATVVRKLSSYARQNNTKKALWELDNILRTIYILDFIDDVELRQSVQKALNRGEAYHRFRRAVSFINGGKFKVQTETEQQVWNDCARLIANAVIYYNTALLSKVYEQKVAAGDLDAIAFIQGMSPVAWQHVNMFGSFEFSDDERDIDLDALAAQYADSVFWSNATQPGQGDLFD
ncbi:MAG: Tn3 family transposase [Hydrogenophaga sp.]|uniref:Tn3 family transposase n=1 Tax=Comamonadaceae TaxID=80864 RepID=UPI000BBCA55A|nr:MULTISPECIES: Tn3 family transposase [Comamonadaceae]MBS3910867.1 Tn3 family transposase [Hydrogenophaga sp.]MDP2162890.1 Tn3 family transposase [Hydrogenophaga sp.]MDP3476881.1 Tn3 family transposase [Hydrogenophaga sp.]